jgi:putative hydrolase of the HAD superfamily
MKHLHILIDFDETLAYRDGKWTATIYQILQNNGYTDITEKMIEPFTHYGFPWHNHEISHRDLFKEKSWWEYMDQLIGQIIINAGVEPYHAPDLAVQFKDYYLDINYWNVFDDTIPFLEAVTKNHKCYIASNHVPELSVLVENLNLSKYFTRIFNSAYIGFEKPNRMFFESILKELRCKKDEVFMIGDSFNADITGAVNFGIRAVLVRCKNTYDYKYCAPNLFGSLKYIPEH